jgi:hypothetical protein
LVLSGFSRHSPREAPPHEGLLRWASVVVPPLGQSWAVEGAREQVDRDTPVSRTPTVWSDPVLVIACTETSENFCSHSTLSRTLSNFS